MHSLPVSLSDQVTGMPGSRLCPGPSVFTETRMDLNPSRSRRRFGAAGGGLQVQCRPRGRRRRRFTGTGLISESRSGSDCDRGRLPVPFASADVTVPGSFWTASWPVLPRGLSDSRPSGMIRGLINWSGCYYSGLPRATAPVFLLGPATFPGPYSN